MEMYLINAKEKFQGYQEAHAVIDTETGISKVSYVNNMTMKEYLDQRPDKENLKWVSRDIYITMMTNYLGSLCTEPKPITKERYFEMLEVLPPSRWGSIGSWEVFHVCERITHNLVSWFAKRGDECYEFVDMDGVSREYLLDKLTSIKEKV